MVDTFVTGDNLIVNFLQQSNNSFSTDSFGEQDTFRLEPVRQFV